MSDLIKLTIGESRPKKWKPLSWLIMLVERTDHSHAFVSWKDEKIGVRKVAEARGSGGRICSNFEFKRVNEVINCHYYYVPQEKIDEIEKFIWVNLRGYAFKQLIGIALMRIAMIFGIRIHNIFGDGNKSMICVELSSNVLAIAKDLKLHIEDIGMKEAHELNLKHRDGFASQDKIDQINKKK